MASVGVDVGYCFRHSFADGARGMARRPADAKTRSLEVLMGARVWC